MLHAELTTFYQICPCMWGSTLRVRRWSVIWILVFRLSVSLVRSHVSKALWALVLSLSFYGSAILVRIYAYWKSNIMEQERWTMCFRPSLAQAHHFCQHLSLSQAHQARYILTETSMEWKWRRSTLWQIVEEVELLTILWVAIMLLACTPSAMARWERPPGKPMSPMPTHLRYSAQMKTRVVCDPCSASQRSHESIINPSGECTKNSKQQHTTL